MGAKCSEMALGTPSQVTPSQALVEEDEDDGEDEEAEEEEEEEDEEASAKADAEKALKGGLVRGKTAAFEEAIDFATSVGINEDMIAHAEAKLQQHKVLREREVFIQELPKFLQSEDADDEAKCQEQIEVGKKHGVLETHLKLLRERIEFIKLGRDLEEEELKQAHEMTTESTRRFVASCFAGRKLTHIDEKGKKVKVVCSLDPAMRQLRIVEEAGAEVCSAPLSSVQACAGALAGLGEQSPLTSLSDEEQDRSIALRADGGGPWLLLEERPELHAEFLLALAVLGSGNGEAKLASTASMKSRPAAAAPTAAAGNVGDISVMLESMEDVEGNDPGQDGKDKKDKKEKKDKKDKKEEKDKKEKKDKEEDGDKKDKKEKKEKKAKK